MKGIKKMLINFIKKVFAYFFEHKNIGEPMRYLLIGGICAVLDLLFLFLMVNFLHIWYLIATTVSFIVVSFLGYFGQKYFTFRNTEKNHKKQLLVFFIVAGFGLAINVFFMFALVSLINLWYILASIITKFIVLIWNYFSNKFVTFRKSDGYFFKKNKFHLIIIIIALFINAFVFLTDTGTVKKINITSQIKNTGNAENYWGNNFFGIEPKYVGGKLVDGLTAYSPSLYKIEINPKEGDYLFFKYGVNDQAITQGDGVVFKIFAENIDNPKNEIFSDVILPLDNVSLNNLREKTVDLSRYKGKKIILFFKTEENINNAFDQALWSDVEYIYRVPIFSYDFFIFSVLTLLLITFFDKIRSFFIRNKLLTFSIIFALFSLLYLYLITQGTYVFHEYRQGAYYNWLADRFNEGQLGQVIKSGENGGDFSYFNGNKFLYFGPFSAVMQLIYRKIFGSILYGGILTYILSLFNLLFFWLIVMAIKNKFYPKSSLLPSIIIMLSYAVGPLMFCVGRSFVYEEAIIVGSTFFLLSLYLAFLYFFVKIKNGVFLLFIGAFFTFSFLSRINLALYIFSLAILVFSISINEIKKQKFQSIKKMILFLFPIIIGIAFIFLYNYLRFNNIFDFGMTHMEPGTSEVKMRMDANLTSSLLYLPINIYQYFFAPPFYTLLPTNSAINPLGPFPKLAGSEYVSSVFLNIPILFFIFYALYLMVKGKMNKELRKVSFGLSAGFFIVTLFIFCMFGNARRYMQDFLPPMLFLSFIGLSEIYSKINKKWKITLSTVLIVIIVYTLILNYLVACNFSFNGRMDRCFNIHNSEYILLN